VMHRVAAAPSAKPHAHWRQRSMAWIKSSSHA
jgi:hypothetical protein